MPLSPPTAGLQPPRCRACRRLRRPFGLPVDFLPAGPSAHERGPTPRRGLGRSRDERDVRIRVLEAVVVRLYRHAPSQGTQFAVAGPPGRPSLPVVGPLRP